MIDKRNIEAILPLTPQQAAMLLYCREPGPQDIGFLLIEFDILGDLDEAAWRAAWKEILFRHEAMRMTVHMPEGKRAMSILWKTAVLPWAYTDLSALAETDLHARLEMHRDAVRTWGLPLDKAPVMDLATFRLGKDRHRVFWSCHHLMTDGWSSGIVIRDVLAVYHAHMDQGPALQPLTTNYRSFREKIKEKDNSFAISFWRQHLDGFTSSNLLAPGRNVPPTAAKDIVSVRLNTERAMALQAGCIAGKYTANALIRGAWALTLSRLCDASDLVFGAVVSGRPADIPDLDSVAGFFCNTVPIRVAIDESRPVSEWLRDLRNAQLLSQPHEHLPLESILDGSGLPNPLIDSLLLVQNLPFNRPDDANKRGLQLANFSSGLTSAYPFTLAVIPGREWTIQATFAPSAFDRLWVERLLHTFGDLLACLAAEPERSIATATDSLNWPADPSPKDGPKKPLLVDSYVGPRNRHELDLVEIWQEVLGVVPVGVRDNFYELGGYSVQILQLSDKIERRFGRRLPPELLVQNPTVETLANLLRQDQSREAQQAEQTYKCLVPLRVSGSRPRLFCINWGRGLFYLPLANRLGPDYPVYVLKPVGTHGGRPMKRIEDIAALYVREIRMVQPNGPYHIIGGCLGCTIAFEVVQQLRAAGEKIEFLAFIDAHAPNNITKLPKAPLPPNPSSWQRFKTDVVLPVWNTVKPYIPIRRYYLDLLFGSDEKKRLVYLFRMRDTIIRAHARYMPKVYPDSAMLVYSKSSLVWDRSHLPWEEGLLEDWRKIAPRIETIDIPCEHGTIFKEPHIVHLVNILKRRLSPTTVEEPARPADMPSVVAMVDPDLARTWPAKLSGARVEHLISRAIHAGRLAEVSAAVNALPPDTVAPTSLELTRNAATVCKAITEVCLDEQRRMVQCLDAAGIKTTPIGAENNTATKQYHGFSLSVCSADLERILAVAGSEGYFPWELRHPRALHSMRHNLNTITLIKNDAVTMRMVLDWQYKAADRPWSRHLRPTHTDYELIKLPDLLWPLYYLVKPYRVAANCLFGWYADRDIGPYLGTPEGLVSDLLDFAGVGRDDTVVDLGCGDGRVLIRAAQERGCKGLGIEKNAKLANLALTRLKAASLEYLVQIECGDATQARLSDATVVFLFLPVEQLPDLLEAIRPRLRPGTRILIHEQAPLGPDLKPDRTKPIITPSGMTVAHLWTVS